MSTSSFMRAWRFATCGVVLVGGFTLAGCGGGSTEGPSLAAQHQAAKKEVDPNLRAKKLVAVALQQLKAGDSAGSDASLAEAMQAASEMKEPAAKAGTLNSVADAIGRSGNLADAKKQLRAARGAADEVEDLPTRIPLLARSAEILAQRLEDAAGAMDILKEAEKLAGQIEDPADKVAAQLRVVGGFYVAKGTGDVERLGAVAVEGARALTEPRKKSEALADAGGVMRRAGQVAEAATLFGESESAAETIEDANSRGYALVHVATRRLTAGDKDDAAKTIKAAELTAEKVTDRAMREELTKKVREVQNKL